MTDAEKPRAASPRYIADCVAGYLHAGDLDDGSWGYFIDCPMGPPPLAD